MLKRFSEIKNFRVLVVDGAVGSVQDLLVDDHNWNVRYLVVAVANTIPVKKVLISPASVQRKNWAARTFTTTLNSRQVMDSPGVDWSRPISRKYEEALVEYYGWPIYWLGRAIQMSPQKMHRLAGEQKINRVGKSEVNLRSAVEICGYQIQSENGPAGYLRDLIINLNSWVVEYGTADPSTWASLKKSMFSTRHISDVDWTERQIRVQLVQEVFDHQPARCERPAITGEPWSANPERIS